MLAIYTRLSKEDDESNSILNQKREGKAFAKKMKLAYRIYDEGMGISGTNEIQDRPKLEQLLNDITQKEITHVWFRSQNRLERNSNTFHVFAALIKKNDVKVYFNDKLEDWNNPNSFLQSSILTAINQYQVALQSYQTKKSLLDNIKEGKSHGIYPYGYKSENGILTINEEEAKIVKLIYKLSLEGMGTRSIAETLNEKDYHTRYRKYGTGTLTVKNKYTGIKTVIDKKDIRWAGNTVRGIIINPIYKGKRKWGDQFFDAPAIFDENYWQKVNDNLKNNSNNKGKKVIHKYLLKGILRCGKCGRNMYGRTRVNKKDHYYQCSSKRYKDKSCGNRSINIDKIENVIWSRFFKGDELLVLLKKDIFKDDNELEKLEILIEKHQGKLKSHQKEKERLILAVSKGVLSDDDIVKYKKQIENKIQEQNKFIADYKIQISNAKHSKKLIKDYEKEFESYSSNLSFLEMKGIVNKYIKDVIVYSWDNNNNICSLLVKFKINISDEPYIFDKKNMILHSITENKLILSSFFNPKIKETFLAIDTSILNMFYFLPNGKILEPPYSLNNDKVEILKNTIIPYGNVTNWNDNSIIKFYNQHPEILCSNTGLSILTTDENEPSYKIAKRKFSYFKRKKNNNSLNDWLLLLKKEIEKYNS